jgi:ribonucleoside-diphosphate reductase alpha chain
VEDVFCVTVDTEDHLWVCNGVVTHNCTEILESTDVDESFVCCLSSLNLVHWDEIKECPDAVDVIYMLLDAVTTEFIEKTKDMPFMERAHKFAKTQRALGLGVLGYHSLLQSLMIPFESMEAKYLNTSIFKKLQEETTRCNKQMAAEYGEPELLVGYGLRNALTTALAPTTSSSFILGQVSPSIEPENSNYYVKDLAKGKYSIKNPYLLELLKEKNQDTTTVWSSILNNGGSVQHLDFLTENEKNVFKTFGEISQLEILQQAAARQKFIDQGQSINLTIDSNTDDENLDRKSVV